MTTIFKEFDTNPQAFINPCDVIKAQSGFPEIAVTTFSEKIISQFLKTNEVKVIGFIFTSNGDTPIYKVYYKGKEIALYLSRVGAPACVAGLEEIIAMGAKKIVSFGCCGVLNESAVGDKIIVPSFAVRDEGTSYHYLPASDEIAMAQDSVNVVTTCLDELEIPFVIGKVWTTDAIYRETKKVIVRRKEQGCLGVDMECSASLAVTQFRNIPFIQFLFGADNLDGPTWDIRNLTEFGENNSNQYLTLAFECGVRM